MSFCQETNETDTEMELYEVLLCDSCEARLDRAYASREVARFWAKAKGWTTERHHKFSGVLIEDACPECSRDKEKRCQQAKTT